MACVGFQVRSCQLGSINVEVSPTGPARSLCTLRIPSEPQAHGIASKAHVTVPDEGGLDGEAGLGHGTVKPDDVVHFSVSVALREEDAPIHAILATERPVRPADVTDVHPFTPVDHPTQGSRDRVPPVHGRRAGGRARARGAAPGGPGAGLEALLGRAYPHASQWGSQP